MVGRFVLRLRSPGKVSDETARLLEELEGCELLDRSLRMLWVEAERAVLERFVEDSTSDWVLIPDPEVEYRLPESRPRTSRRESE